jgi:ribosomal protein S18 acetylase RimI-like enzyme
MLAECESRARGKNANRTRIAIDESSLQTRPDMANVRPLELSDVPACGEAVARAFRNNPGFIGVFERTEEERVRLLWRFAQTTIPMYLRYGRTYGAVSEGAVRAALLVLPSSRFEVPWTAELRLALVALRVSGWTTSNRIGVVDALMKRTRPKRPHHYVYMLATDPDWQGRGLASGLLENLPGRNDGEEYFLHTDDPKNLPFYERRGFTVVSEHALSFGAQFFQVWCLTTHPDR